MNALSEMAKGATKASVSPVWKREIIRPRTNPSVKFLHYDYHQIEGKDVQTVNMNDMIHNSFLFGQKEIEALKRQAVGNLKCPTFEVLSAFLWRLRTRALQLPAEQEVRLLFGMDARKRFDPPLPEGFYGNAICSACAKTTAGELANKPLPFAVKLIRQAKMAVNDEYMRSLIDFMELKGHQACPRFTAVENFVVSDVIKIGFGDVDFGWGRAAYGGPIADGVPGSFFIPYRNTSGVEGILVPFCLPSAAMQRFEAEIREAI